MYENIKKQLKAIKDNSSIQSENSFQIKSERSYLAEIKSKHPALYIIVLTVVGVDSIIIDRVVIMIVIRVLDRVNPVTVIMEQNHQCQSIGISKGVKLIL